MDALVEIVLEIFGAVLEEILTPIFSKIRLPKWLKIMSLSLLVIAVMGGLIYGFYYLWNEMGLVGIWVCLALLAFPFVIWAIVALGICYRFGSLRRAKKKRNCPRSSNYTVPSLANPAAIGVSPIPMKSHCTRTSAPVTFLY